MIDSETCKMISSRLHRFDELQNKTKEILKQHPKHIAWLLRHSIRDPIPRDPSLRDVALTESGHRLAQALGHRLELPVTQYLSSPMLRCVQTMNGLRNGQIALPPLQCTRTLGDPGPFVIDTDRTWEAYAKLGKHKLVETLTLRPQELRGFASVIQGVENLFRILGPNGWNESLSKTRSVASNTSDDTEGITLACSHDIIMAVLISYFLKQGLSSEHWPEFTEGIMIVYHHDHIEVYYRDFRFFHLLSP